MSTHSGHTSANIQSDDDHGSSPNNYYSLQSYGLEVSDIHDRTFAAGKGLKEISITYEDDLWTSRMTPEAVDRICDYPSRDEGVALRILYFDEHPYSTGSFVRDAIGIPRDQYAKLLRAYDVSPAFLSHMFRQGVAVGARVCTSPTKENPDLRKSDDDLGKETSTGHDQDCTAVTYESGPEACDERMLSSSKSVGIGEPQRKLIGLRNKQAPATTFYHIWWEVNAGTGIGIVDVYTITLLSSGQTTLLALRFPKKLEQSLSHAQVHRMLANEPIFIHITLAELAIASWERVFYGVHSAVVKTEEKTYLRSGDTLTSGYVIELHSSLSSIQKQILEITQLHFNVNKLLDVFQEFVKLSAKAGRIVDMQAARDLHFLRDQAHAIEIKFENVRKRVELLIQLNYHLVNEQAAKRSIEENIVMKSIAQKSTDIAAETRKDSASMKALTNIAVLAIPTTVVASICGTNFISYEPTTDTIHISHWVWTVFVLSFFLSLTIILVWWLWDPGRQRFSLVARKQHNELENSNDIARGRVKKEKSRNLIPNETF